MDPATRRIFPTVERIVVEQHNFSLTTEPTSGKDEQSGRDRARHNKRDKRKAEREDEQDRQGQGPKQARVNNVVNNARDR